LKYATTGEDFFLTVKETLASWELGLKKKLTSVTNDGGESMYVSKTGVKTSGKEILAALDSTYLCKQAFPVMNFRKSKFFSELNDHRLHPTLRPTLVFTTVIRPVSKDTQHRKSQ
jgi:hypothetical protein